VPSLTPDTRVATPLIRQRWQSVSFVHWRYRASDVRGLVPAAFELDTFEGDAWVSVVAFLTSFAVGGVVPLPGRRIYPQTNVRTYVRAPDGTDGLWFLALEVTNLANVLLGRPGLPYGWSEMAVDRPDGFVTYRARRRIPPTRPVASYDIAVELGSGTADDQDERTEFLTGRWHTYAKRGPVLVRFDVEHAPWRLVPAHAVVHDDALLRAVGLPAAPALPLTHYSERADAAIGVGAWSQERRVSGSRLWRPTSKRAR